MESKKVLTPQDITQLGIRSSLLQASFNFERMQAAGWLLAMLPCFKKIYKNDKKGLSYAMKDNLEFINTHPNLVGFLMGLMVSMEEAGEKRETIKGLKVALFGPLAGIGDAIFWFTLLPIMAGLCSSFAMNGQILGPLLYFIFWLAVWVARIPLTHLGYNLGVAGVQKIHDNSQHLAQAATLVGITVIGGLVSSYVNIDVQTLIPVNEIRSISLQTDFFDKILPNLLPLLYTLLMFYLLKIKKINPVVLILITFLGAIGLSFFGIL